MLMVISLKKRRHRQVECIPSDGFNLPLEEGTDIFCELQEKKEGTIGGESYRGRFALTVIKTFLIIRAAPK